MQGAEGLADLASHTLCLRSFVPCPARCCFVFPSTYCSFAMRFGFVATVLFSAAAFVQAAPSPVQERDLVDNLQSAAAELFSVTIDSAYLAASTICSSSLIRWTVKSLLNVATPIVGSVFAEATSVVGEFLETDTVFVPAATSLLGQAESALGPTGTAIANELNNVKNAIITPNGAVSDVAAVRPLSLGAAAVVGSVLLGAYAVL
ncbi:hypothetical protein C8Q76DRAFT_430572 [Earliella scabrosa]|nr:hypothetical protein C8Q76DRAFT_430572 [Earliella scabrosa]